MLLTPVCRKKDISGFECLAASPEFSQAYDTGHTNIVKLSKIPDIKFVQNFTLLDFQAKTLTPSISPNFDSFSDKYTNN